MRKARVASRQGACMVVYFLFMKTRRAIDCNVFWPFGHLPASETTKWVVSATCPGCFNKDTINKRTKKEIDKLRLTKKLGLVELNLSAAKHKHSYLLNHYVNQAQGWKVSSCYQTCSQIAFSKLHRRGKASKAFEYHRQSSSTLFKLSKHSTISSYLQHLMQLIEHRQLNSRQFLCHCLSHYFHLLNLREACLLLLKEAWDHPAVALMKPVRIIWFRYLGKCRSLVTNLWSCWSWDAIPIGFT